MDYIIEIVGGASEFSEFDTKKGVHMGRLVLNDENYNQFSFVAFSEEDLALMRRIPLRTRAQFAFQLLPDSYRGFKLQLVDFNVM